MYPKTISHPIHYRDQTSLFALEYRIRYFVISKNNLNYFVSIFRKYIVCLTSASASSVPLTIVFVILEIAFKIVSNTVNADLKVHIHGMFKLVRFMRRFRLYYRSNTSLVWICFSGILWRWNGCYLSHLPLPVMS